MGGGERGPLTSLQYLVTATPRGCSLLASAVPTTARTFLRGSVATSTSRRTRMTLGTPWVMVPVLSNITVFICQNNRISVTTTWMEGTLSPHNAEAERPSTPQAGSNAPSRQGAESSAETLSFSLSHGLTPLPLPSHKNPHCGLTSTRLSQRLSL